MLWDWSVRVDPCCKGGTGQELAAAGGHSDEGLAWAGSECAMVGRLS